MLFVCMSVETGFGGWGWRGRELHAPDHPSTAVLWLRVTCFTRLASLRLYCLYYSCWIFHFVSFFLDSDSLSSCKSFPVCLSTYYNSCLPVRLSVWLSGCLAVWLSVCLSVCLSVWLNVYLSICLSVCLIICLFLCVMAWWQNEGGLASSLSIETLPLAVFFSVPIHPLVWQFNVSFVFSCWLLNDKSAADTLASLSVCAL